MQLKEIHEQKRNAIETRLQEFRDAYLQSDEVIFEELCFCLMTPQTKAKSAAKVIDKLKEKNLLLTGSAGEIKKWMAPIRFNNNKSQYIVEARRLFSDEKGIRIKSKLDSLGDPIAMRSWLVSNVKGYGLK